MFSMEPELDTGTETIGERGLLGDPEGTIWLANPGCWSHGRSIEKL